MAGRRGLTADERRRLWFYDYLCLVAYFTKPPKKLGDFLTDILELLRSLVGNARASGFAHHANVDREKLLKLRAADFRRACYDKRSGTLTRLIESPLSKGLNSGSFDGFNIWRHPSNSMATALDIGWQIEFQPAPIMLGQTLDPMLWLSINLERLHVDQIAELFQFTRVFFRRCAQTRVCYYGLGDINDNSEVFAGRYFSSAYQGSARWHRQLELISWIGLGSDRRRRMRNLYWVNLLGREMTKMVGGNAALADGCKEFGLGVVEPLPYQCTLFGLTEDAGDFRFGRGPIFIPTWSAGFIQWIDNKLRADGLL